MDEQNCSLLLSSLRRDVSIFIGNDGSSLATIGIHRKHLVSTDSGTQEPGKSKALADDTSHSSAYRDVQLGEGKAT